MQHARSLFLSVSIAFLPFGVSAQTLDRESIALIRETADSICGEIMRDGSSRDIEIEGEVSAELKGLAKRLADAGIEGSARLEDGRYANVLRDELGEELKSARDCRMKVFDKLLDRLDPATPPAQTGQVEPVPQGQDIVEYPDTGYVELAGTVLWGEFINCSVLNTAPDQMQVTSINYLLQGMYGPQPFIYPCNYNCGIMGNNSSIFSGPPNNNMVSAGSCSVTAMY